MTNGISIGHSKDMRTNDTQIPALTREEPAGDTVNGNERTVVPVREDCMERHISEPEARPELYAHLARAADDVRLGSVQDIDEAFDDIERELSALSYSR